VQYRIELIDREGEGRHPLAAVAVVALRLFSAVFSEYAARQCSRALKKPP
jgi:hypothetical protein